MPLDHQTYVKLNNGTLMPQFGMGVYSIPEGGHSADSVREAVHLGYRHFGMSHAGSLEKAAVEMLLSCGVNRDELWITTKLWPSEYRRGKTSEAIDSKLSALGLDYLDLLLQHQQFADYLGAWEDLEGAVAAGKIRAIGLSRCELRHYEAIVDSCSIKPAVLQVECHPYCQQGALKDHIGAYGTVVQSWFPAAGGYEGLLEDSVLAKIAARHGVSAGLVALRWHVQQGNVIAPKCMDAMHLAQNAQVFDFELAQEEVDAIARLDRGKHVLTSDKRSLEAPVIHHQSFK